MAKEITFDRLQDAVESGAAVRCHASLQPAGGEGTKVFPPTYAGAVYATEKRRLPTYAEPVDCVLLDSVPSQANRMEEALQEAIDNGRLAAAGVRLPLIEVDFTRFFPGADLAGSLRLLEPVGKISSLQAPHRIVDAILRDSVVVEEKKPFRARLESDESTYGKRLRRVSAQNATALFELCPTALLFGMWDSTGPKGGLGAKIERAMVSEIVGINASFGVRTSSRIDPVIRKNPQLYATSSGGWTALESEAAKEGAKQEPKKYGKKLSELNLGNVTPSFGKYSKGAEGPDIMQRPDLSFDYRLRAGNRELSASQRFDSNWPDARENGIAPGGVTIDRAEQTVVLSFPALRRLRFPINEKSDANSDTAARVVIAALGICAASLAADAGLDLRSRCLLWPNEPVLWEILGKPGDRESGFAIDADATIVLLKNAIDVAKAAGLPWREEPLQLVPSDDLVKLVVRSQELALQTGGEGGE